MSRRADKMMDACLPWAIAPPHFPAGGFAVGLVKYEAQLAGLELLRHCRVADKQRGHMLPQQCIERGSARVLAVSRPSEKQLLVILLATLDLARRRIVLSLAVLATGQSLAAEPDPTTFGWRMKEAKGSRPAARDLGAPGQGGPRGQWHVRSEDVLAPARRYAQCQSAMLYPSSELR
jgi:hypothetical protein